MKKYLIYTIIAVIALVFTACGGGDANYSGTSTQVNVVDCNSSTVITDYTTLLSEDVIVKDVDNTTISTYHDINGTKRLCILSGSAYILR